MKTGWIARNRKSMIMLQAIIGFLGVFVGSIVKPISDWVTYRLNSKQRCVEKKQKQIEEAYYLSQN